MELLEKYIRKYYSKWYYVCVEYQILLLMVDEVSLRLGLLFLILLWMFSKKIWLTLRLFMLSIGLILPKSKRMCLLLLWLISPSKRMLYLKFMLLFTHFWSSYPYPARLSLFSNMKLVLLFNFILPLFILLSGSSLFILLSRSSLFILLSRFSLFIPLSRLPVSIL